MQPIRVTYNQACELLSIKRNALRELTLNDPTFPKAYKAGTTRQARLTPQNLKLKPSN